MKIHPSNIFVFVRDGEKQKFSPKFPPLSTIHFLCTEQILGRLSTAVLAVNQRAVDPEPWLTLVKQHIQLLNLQVKKEHLLFHKRSLKYSLLNDGPKNGSNKKKKKNEPSCSREGLYVGCRVNGYPNFQFKYAFFDLRQTLTGRLNHLWQDVSTLHLVY